MLTDQQHPITPPEELVEEWCDEWYRLKVRINTGIPEYVATQAARWGAEQRLEAVCEWLETGPYGFSIEATAPSMIKRLRAAMHPQPPSLAEEALKLLDEASNGLGAVDEDTIRDIRRALKRLQQLEQESHHD